MSIILTPIIEAFVRAKNAHNTDAIILCFSEDAVVYDEGQKFSGRAAIKKWLDDSNAKYSVTLVPIKLVDQASENVLTAQVSGNFEGSPVPLKFHFTVHEDKIRRLRIQLAGD